VLQVLDDGLQSIIAREHHAPLPFGLVQHFA